MSYIKFDKLQLVNLEYALGRELLRTSRSGAYGSTTIINCNTRRYHGLLVAPQQELDNDLHVLLSSFDETIIQRDSAFNLGIHKFPGGIYRPGGHKYIRDFDSEPIPTLIYRVGGVVLKKETLFTSHTERYMIRYTLLDAHSETKLQFRPFLAFRNVHHLSKANNYLNKKYNPTDGGIQVKLYDGYTPLYMQFSKTPEYVHVPDWYYNIEYFRDQERGFDYQEDLYVPGYFEVPIKKGESIVFAASLDEVKPQSLKQMFYRERNKRTPRNSFKNCLENAAEQFLVKQEQETEIVTGYPWRAKGGRDTFIAAPGLLLARNKEQEFKKVIDAMIQNMDGSFFKAKENTEAPAADASLWFIRSLQQYALYLQDVSRVWKAYGKTIKKVLEGYANGGSEGVVLREDGLLETGKNRLPVTWMNAVVDNKPVTLRSGAVVEINALWYNALKFSLEAAEKANETSFIYKWKPVADKIPEAFQTLFWDSTRGYLADYVGDQGKDWSVRPNMVLATALPFSPLQENQKREVLKTVENHLVTPRGLRSLSPRHPDYKGEYAGDQKARDLAYHQGAAWPWLLTYFAEGYLRLYGKQGLPRIKQLLEGFEEAMINDGIGTVSEVYAGNPPHHAGGNISQAWNVAELLRLSVMLEKFDDGTDQPYRYI
ncbi:MAG: amylo-alpha-1,6-glucosidase [Bacteroidota bacterium]